MTLNREICYNVYLEEHIRPHCAARVVLGNTLVHIRPVGMIDDHSRSRILLGVGDVVIHHDYDVVIRDAVGMDNLVSVAYVGLVPVVEPAITTSHKENPQVSILRGIVNLSCKFELSFTSGISGKS